MTREEYNLPLTKESYEHMRPKADGILISKTRYLIPEKDGLTIELDVFDAPYEGLYLAEVEFSSEEQALSYNPPVWFGEDVTNSGTFQVVRTGNKVWNYHPNCTVRVEVDSLDFEMEEAYPFPIAVVRDDYEPIPLPNPWTWGETSDPDSKAAKHVDVWDESDAKTIVILGIISFVLLMAGLSGLSLLITMWAVAAAYFHSKHEKVRKEILEQRNKHGISGSGLDHKFRW